MEIFVVAHPNSKRPRVEKDLVDEIHVYVSEPPIDGKANAAVIESLARYFAVKKSCVLLVAGEKSKRKKFLIYQSKIVSGEVKRD